MHCLAVTHRTARLVVRERIAATASEALLRERWRGELREAVVLRTCGRYELYLVPALARPVSPHLLAELTGVPSDLLTPAVRAYRGMRAVRHLFQVAAGADSPLPGEPHVLGQVRAAYLEAAEAGMVGPLLGAAFRAAIHAGRRVRAETGLMGCAQSYAQLAGRAVVDAAGAAARVLIVGAGTLARELAAELHRSGVRGLTFASRHAQRACMLAHDFAGAARALEELRTRLADFDAVVACTSSPVPLLTAAHFARAARPVFVLDLGLPRNVDPAAAECRYVTLLTLEELVGKALVPAAVRAAVERILRAEEERLARWWRAREAAANALRDSAA